jgi:hypothetical protein
MNNPDYALESDVIFIARQIATFKKQLCDDDFMKSFTGKTIKNLIQGHPLVKAISSDKKYMEDVVTRLKELIEPEIVDKAILNIF